MDDKRKPIDPAKKLMTREDVAEMFGVDKRTVSRWVAAGRLRAVRPSRNVTRFDPKAVDAFRIKCGGI